MEQLPKGIYDIRDLQVARCDLVKHRCEQEKIIATNEENLHSVSSCQQLPKIHGGINPAETTAENDDSFFARPTSDASDHRVLSVAELPVRSRRETCRCRQDYRADGSSLFVSNSLDGATPLGPA